MTVRSRRTDTLIADLCQGCLPARPRTAMPLVVLLVALLLLAGCTGTGGNGVSTDGPRVVTSNTVLMNLVKQVGDSRLGSVASVVPAGIEVEDYSPRPDDIRTVAAANLMIYNGMGLDRWIEKLLESANPSIPRLALAEHVPPPATPGEQRVRATGNPHLWLNVHNARSYVEQIRDQLASVDPAGADVYRENASRYLSQLDELDTWIHQQVATIPPENRKLVTFHDAFAYFAEHYGLQQVGVIAPSPGQEPSAGDLAKLVEQVQAANVKAIFGEAQFSPRLAETLAREAGIQHVVTDLYNDSLGPPPADSYLGIMRHDVDRIVSALK